MALIKAHIETVSKHGFFNSWLPYYIYTYIHVFIYFAYIYIYIYIYIYLHYRKRKKNKRWDSVKIPNSHKDKIYNKKKLNEYE